MDDPSDARIAYFSMELAVDPRMPSSLAFLNCGFQRGRGEGSPKLLGGGF